MRAIVLLCWGNLLQVRTKEPLSLDSQSNIVSKPSEPMCGFTQISRMAMWLTTSYEPSPASDAMLRSNRRH